MRVLIQRVLEASVAVETEVVGSIGKGYMLLVAATDGDDKEIAEKMARKVAKMRLFRDPDGPSHFHLSLLDVGGSALVVSQFTLFADTRKGRRPSFIHAADPEGADRFYVCSLDRRKLVYKGLLT
ncbi:MAG: D-aminoacyl-tRNA deacylase, partial [Candidatus Sumerlaeota bacterium]